ncbi:MAG: hypothetical protein INQ03_24375 [Candidatus Heimdallarchaeota archaeon]|nr:hypothetical protein [Candidatus Heimdallarchaeota archaeon]
MSATDRIIGGAIQEGLVTKRKDHFKLLKNFEAAAISMGPDDILADVMVEFQRLKASSGT